MDLLRCTWQGLSMDAKTNVPLLEADLTVGTIALRGLKL